MTKIKTYVFDLARPCYVTEIFLSNKGYLVLFVSRRAEFSRVRLHFLSFEFNLALFCLFWGVTVDSEYSLTAQAVTVAARFWTCTWREF